MYVYVLCTFIYFYVCICLLYMFYVYQFVLIYVSIFHYEQCIHMYFNCTQTFAISQIVFLRQTT